MTKLKLTPAQRRLLNKRRKSGVVRLQDLEVAKVDLVGTPANLQNFLIVKNFQSGGKIMPHDIVELIENSDGSLASIVKSQESNSTLSDEISKTVDVDDTNSIVNDTLIDSDSNVDNNDNLSENNVDVKVDEPNVDVKTDESNVDDNVNSGIEDKDSTNASVVEIDTENNIKEVDTENTEPLNEIQKEISVKNPVSKELKNVVLSFLDTLLMEVSGLLYWLNRMNDGDDVIKYVKAKEIMSSSLVKMSSALFNVAEDLKKPRAMKSFVEDMFSLSPVIKMEDSLRVELTLVLKKSLHIFRNMFVSIASLPESCTGREFLLSELAINSLLDIAVDFQTVAKKCSKSDDEESMKSLELDEKEKKVEKMKKEEIIKFLEGNEFSDVQLDEMRGIFSPMLESAKTMATGNDAEKEADVAKENITTEDTDVSTETNTDEDPILKALAEIKNGQIEITDKFTLQEKTTSEISKKFETLSSQFVTTQKEVGSLKDLVGQIGGKTPTSKSLKGQELDTPEAKDKNTFDGVFFHTLK